MIGRSISSLSNTLFIEEGIIACSFRVKWRIYWNDARKGENPYMINKIDFEGRVNCSIPREATWWNRNDRVGKFASVEQIQQGNVLSHSIRYVLSCIDLWTLVSEGKSSNLGINQINRIASYFLCSVCINSLWKCDICTNNEAWTSKVWYIFRFNVRTFKICSNVDHGGTNS